MAKLNVLSVVAEVYPLIKTGGLADVAGALPAALAPENVMVTTLVPGYPAVKAALEKPELVHNYGHLFGGGAGLLKGRARGLDLLVLDAPHLFDRPGSPYVDVHGIDWYDNPIRFAALSRVAADLGLGLVPGLVPDVVHAHDWQTGLVSAYLRYSGEAHPPSVMTVHNLAFQGQYGRDLMPALGLPPQAFSLDGVEYYGAVGYLKSGLQMADRITTVSPTYAAEIRTAEGGMGLDGLLRTRSAVVTGILNGVDDQAWDPASDPMIEAAFSLADMSGRARNKQALQARLGLEQNPDVPLFGVVSRLTWQKGLDLLLERLPSLLATGTQLAVLGSGEPWIADGFAEAAAGNPSRIGMVRGYDEALAHQIQAGSDVIVVPSRFEPCGLTQLCALRYGALPLVARVGGLADTVIDANEAALAAGVATGFQFSPVIGDTLQGSIRRAASAWSDQTLWKAMQKNAMTTDVSWRRPARAYASLYRGLVQEQTAA